MHLLAASSRNAGLAAEVGAGFTFAHFINASGNGKEAVEEYRKAFQPSALANESYVSVAVFVIIGKTVEEAEDMAAAFDLWFLSSQSPKRAAYYLPTPEKTQKTEYTLNEQAEIKKNRQKAIIGDPKMVKQGIE
ncbi:LLM class flavin-dependent oxidoreductase [Desemzia sp. RIT804]|uniref:LLM class flavin-dependent oxidoreductase n=1 Tax=Desemzia sp. RIT 804 TaxID=2810209 RepID=UPI00194F129C|nr:LLM class flavin-dependent oxidoreductase [Desemzia sp. RIT 804]MBM6614498.1 LLM class flavin-dependent oxidoreductase [Desemzia sp. RIT 804]